jgi:hypothetical protein
MTGGVGWQKKGVAHDVFLTEKGGGAPKNISSEGGGAVIYYSGEKFDMYRLLLPQGGSNNRCFARYEAGFVGLPSQVQVKFEPESNVRVTSCLAVFVVH